VAVVSCVVLTVALAPIAYHVMFSLFQSYDDEGSVLIPLKEYLAGGNLYDQVYWGYGPLSPEVWGSLFSLFGIGVTHDSGRFVVIVIWLATSGLVAASTYRATQSVLLGITSQLLTFRILTTLTYEPMHPGGLIVLLLAVIVAVAFLALPRHTRLAMALLGALLASLTLVKVNVGGFAILSAALALVATYPALASRRVIRLPVEAVFVATPALLMARNFSEAWVEIFAAHVTIAALAVVLALRTLPPDPDRRLVQLRPLLIGFAAAAVIELSGAVVTGSSPAGIFRAIITDPLQFPDTFSVQFNFPSAILIFDLVALAGCILYWQRRKSNKVQSPAWRTGFALVSIATGVLLGLTAAGFIFPNANANSSGRAELAMLGLAWIALIRRPGVRDPTPGLPIRLLVPIAVLQALHAYPVAGSQIGFAAFLLLPVGAICIANGLAELRQAVPRPAAPALRLTALALLVTIAAWTTKDVLIDGGRGARRTYAAQVPLKLPGAERIHLPSTQGWVLRHVTRELNKHCRTYFGIPGLDSFYLWARQDPPTPLNTGDWMYLWDSDRQRRALKDIRRQTGLCLLRNNVIASFYSRAGPIPNRPLYSWLTRPTFKRVARIGDYEVLVRRHRGGDKRVSAEPR
jgi:hypothetical protein